MHWCAQESKPLAMSIPFVGYFARKVYKRYHSLMHGKKHDHNECTAGHAEHTTYIHMVPLMPNPPGRDILTIEEVDSIFGQLATILLMFDRKLLETDIFPPSSEFLWFLSPDDTLSARWGNKFFVWDGQDWKTGHPDDQEVSNTCS
jgi:hypothetical protein